MNMSYCRFENTVRDLQDCYDSDDMWDDSDLNEYEKPARKRLIELCNQISADLSHEVEDD